MKLKLSQLALFAGGAVAAAATGSMKGQTAHAATVTVHKGDTAYKIAKEHKTSLKKVISDNHLKEIETDNGPIVLVVRGQKLNVNDGKKFKNDYVPKVKKAAVKKAAVNKTANIKSAVSQAPVANTQARPAAQQQTVQANAVQQQRSQTATQSAPLSGSEEAAKNWIVSRESGGNYNARNGQYVGKYQLSASYLGGDYSPAHQDAVANQYVKGRYGSWTNAKAFWASHGWY